jgi:hypothetical protein
MLNEKCGVPNPGQPDTGLGSRDSGMEGRGLKPSCGQLARGGFVGRHPELPAEHVDDPVGRMIVGVVKALPGESEQLQKYQTEPARRFAKFFSGVFSNIDDKTYEVDLI